MDTAEIDKKVNVIEIGPGIGALTEFLAESAVEVMAFEIDDRLVPILADTLRDFDNVTVVNQDILKVDLAQYIAEFKNPDLPIKVVANLPYYNNTDSHALIESGIPFSEFVVMMQKKWPIGFGSAEYQGFGSCRLRAYYMTAKVAFIVPRTVFVPALMWIRLFSRWCAESSRQLRFRMRNSFQGLQGQFCPPQENSLE